MPPIRIRRPYCFAVLLTLFYLGAALIQSTRALATEEHWLDATATGQYDSAVDWAEATPSSALHKLLNYAKEKRLAEDPQWRAFIHYKPAFRNQWLSQVDARHFFMSESGKHSPDAELSATLAAMFSNTPKPPLRLTAYCRFVARRTWLLEQLPPRLKSLIPEQTCPEYERYISYLNADVLTLIFPTAHPNSPSSAFGHTLLRIDRNDQPSESQLLNMSINFAAEVPEGVSSTAYAINGLAGGFKGKFRLLPYHMKLREYGQIENRDTWEYELAFSQSQVDLILRHAYEMLISHYDYYFFSENCSYHLLSLIEVALVDQPLTDNFRLWTIPIDTIRLLEERQLIRSTQFVPSAIRQLRTKQLNLPKEDVKLALTAHKQTLEVLDEKLPLMNPTRQAGILDLLSDYERYQRLKTNPSAQGSSVRERQILSKRSKLGIQSNNPKVSTPRFPPETGHGTSRVSLNHINNRRFADSIEFQFRPAYHDFRDPSAGFDSKATIELGLIGIGYDKNEESIYFRQFTLVNIESLEPQGIFFKPVSWHTRLDWHRETREAGHELTFNVGAGITYRFEPMNSLLFLLGETDLVDAPDLADRRQFRVGASLGAHIEPIDGFRMGLEANLRQQVGNQFRATTAEAWLGYAIGQQWSINASMRLHNVKNEQKQKQTILGIRSYF